MPRHTQRHPQPADAELEAIVGPARRLTEELARLRTARAALRQDNAALIERNKALAAQNADLQASQPAAAPVAGPDPWEAYSAGVQNGYDHQTEGTQPNWFAVHDDYLAWVEQTKS